MQLSLRHWPDMRLTWVSGCAMVHSGQEPGAGMTALVANASDTGELPVVVTSHTIRLLPAMMNELADVLAEHLPQRCSRVRLIAWNSGCLHDDRPAPAYQLATRLGLEVIAPAGPLLGVPGGSLFAAAGRGAQRPGGWWRFAPGSAPSRVGWRYPAPHWDPDLGEGGDLGNGLVVDQIPAGLWLHRDGYRSMTDLVFSVPVDPDNPALVVSHPDEEPLHREELARALAVLPRRTVERLVFTPYGPDPVTDGRLGEVAAQLLGTATRTRAGLPLYGSGGQRALVTVDCDGRPRWRPFVRELRCDPRTESVEAADWVNPAPDLLSEPIAPATFALGSGWAAEVIEAGLWIRPTQSPDPGEWARGLPLNVNECAIVLGTTSGAYPPPPAALLDTLLERLPADARNRIRFAVPRGADDDVMRLATSLADRVSGEAEVRVISVGGRRRARAAYDERTIDQRAIDQRAIDQRAVAESTSPAMPALRDPTPYPPRPGYQPAPGQPASGQPASGQPAHAADNTSPLRQPTPYPPQPTVRQPTPYPPHPAVRQPTPYPPHPAVRQPTPYPPHPAVQQPTPYPPQPTVRQPAHAAHEGTPPTQPPVRQPTPYPPHPAVQQPTPYPPQPAVHQPTHAAHPSGRLPFPSSAHDSSVRGMRRPESPLNPPPVTPPPMTQAPVSPAPLPPSALSSAPPSPAPLSPAPLSPAPPSPVPLPPSPVPPPTHAARQPMPPNPALTGPPAPVSPTPFPSLTRAVRAPGSPPVPPMPPARPAYPANQPAGPGSRQPVPPAPMAAPPVHPANQPSAPPVHAARQPFPQPPGPPRPQVTGRATPPMAGPQSGPPTGSYPSPYATGSHQTVSPGRDPATEPSLDDSQELLQRTEIRSHRTAAGKGGRASRDDDKATASDASELNRLLGFFDEIRKARAWDEEPAGSHPGGA